MRFCKRLSERVISFAFVWFCVISFDFMSFWVILFGFLTMLCDISSDFARYFVIIYDFVLFKFLQWFRSDFVWFCVILCTLVRFCLILFGFWVISFGFMWFWIILLWYFRIFWATFCYFVWFRVRFHMNLCTSVCFLFSSLGLCYFECLVCFCVICDFILFYVILSDFVRFSYHTSQYQVCRVILLDISFMFTILCDFNFVEILKQNLSECVNVWFCIILFVFLFCLILCDFVYFYAILFSGLWYFVILLE